MQISLSTRILIQLSKMNARDKRGSNGHKLRLPRQRGTHRAGSWERGVQMYTGKGCEHEPDQFPSLCAVFYCRTRKRTNHHPTFYIKAHTHHVLSLRFEISCAWRLATFVFWKCFRLAQVWISSATRGTRGKFYVRGNGHENLFVETSQPVRTMEGFVRPCTCNKYCFLIVVVKFIWLNVW